MSGLLFDINESAIDAAFREFDAQHPEVFDLFADYARRAKQAGHDHYSADAILHRIRWFHHIDRGNREFKLNNNFTSRYARKLIEHDPEFAGFFELRVLKSRGAA